MKKTKTTAPKEARSKFISDFMLQMNSLAVLDGNFRSFIVRKYLAAIERLDGEKLTTPQKWDKTDRSILFKEYDEIESQVKLLRIFSDGFMFDSGINSAWRNMLNTFNPGFNPEIIY